MKLHRFASIHYDAQLPAEWNHFGVTAGAIRVKAWPAESAEDGSLKAHFVQASALLNTVPTDSEESVQLPDQLREECERAIEILANHVALFNRVRRKVFSVDPALAIEPETAGDAIAMHRYDFSRQANHELRFLSLRMPTLDELHALSDRLEGVDLMAEVYAHSSASGRFRDYVRFFEAAFKRPFTMMEKKLAQTLDPRMEYGAAEIRRWISYRHPLTHMDAVTDNVPHGEASVRPVMSRMEQAALDVLFNKARWGAWSSERRNGRYFSAYSRGESAAWTITDPSTAGFSFSMMDEFGVYPTGRFLLTMPAGWRALTQFRDVSPLPSSDEAKP